MSGHGPSVGAVLVIGETLIDVLPASRGDGADLGVRELPGGSPANVAVTLGRLGRGPVLVTTLADDARGAAARDWLEASDVTVVAQPPATGRTSAAAVRLAADGSATYDFDLTWDLSPEILARATAADGIAVLHVGSIATVLDPGADTVEAALHGARGRSLVTFDPNARPAVTPHVARVLPRVARLVGLSDVVKASDEDLAWYHPGVDPVEVARAWAGSGPVLVVVTRGADGSVFVRGDDVVTVPGRPATVVDTIGAGDTFMGALIDALVGVGVHGPTARGALAALSREDLRRVGSRAASAAAITVSRPGADPPTSAELDAVARAATG